MKSFRLLFVVASIWATAIVLPAVADDTTSTPPAASTTDAEQAQKVEAFKAAVEQLNLTEAQKAQIKQIRASTPDKTERHKQILAVLTPEQKAKLRAILRAHRNS